MNDELGAVSRMMQAAVGRLNPDGRLAVITFHSLEDRIVKSEMQQAARGCTCPPEFPVCVCGKKPLVKLVTRKPIVSGPAELEENPRARSAKPALRKNFDRKDEPPWQTLIAATARRPMMSAAGIPHSRWSSRSVCRTRLRGAKPRAMSVHVWVSRPLTALGAPPPC